MHQCVCHVKLLTHNWIVFIDCMEWAMQLPCYSMADSFPWLIFSSVGVYVNIPFDFTFSVAVQTCLFFCSSFSIWALSVIKTPLPVRYWMILLRRWPHIHIICAIAYIYIKSKFTNIIIIIIGIKSQFKLV